MNGRGDSSVGSHSGILLEELAEVETGPACPVDVLGKVCLFLFWMVRRVV
jgi:hypothetical protein